MIIIGLIRICNGQYKKQITAVYNQHSVIKQPLCTKQARHKLGMNTHIEGKKDLWTSEFHIMLHCIQ